MLKLRGKLALEHSIEMLQLIRPALEELLDVDVLRDTRAGDAAQEGISLGVYLVHVLALVTHLGGLGRCLGLLFPLHIKYSFSN